jgi:hypothetical protein
MKQALNKITKYLGARPSIELARLWPSHLTLSVMRKLNEIHLRTGLLQVITLTVKHKAPCNLLIFGLGNDSVFWSRLNRGGVTIFLEDNLHWFQKITKKSKNLTAFLVNYHTKRSDWQMLLESPSLLDMPLPNNVEKEKWDIILVDAPEGVSDQSPGRMKSIYLSSRLVKDAGDIFIHDCQRKVEDIYSNKFIKKENLAREIQSPGGFLRHYHITHRPT